MNLSKIIERINIFLEYYLKADTKYNIHPPFLYNFIEFVFDRERIYYDFNTIQETSECIKRDFTIIPTEKFSIRHHQNQLSISRLYQKAGHSILNYECLFRIALFLKPKQILELGTCVGMSGLPFALACKSAKIRSLEGNKFLSLYAQNLFNQYNLKNIQCIHTEFETYLNNSKDVDIDFVFLDGDHRYDTTMNYFSKIINITNDSAIIIMDDIHFSSEMHKAWKQIINHPSIQCSLETQRWGFLFKNKLLTKGNFVHIHEYFKPWRTGIF